MGILQRSFLTQVKYMSIVNNQQDYITALLDSQGRHLDFYYPTHSLVSLPIWRNLKATCQENWGFEWNLLKKAKVTRLILKGYFLLFLSF